MKEERDIFETIIRALVGMPDAVRVDETQDQRGVLFTLHVDPRDMGKVIGKGGQLIQAMRLIMRSLGAKREAFISVKVYDPNPQYSRAPIISDEELRSL